MRLIRICGRSLQELCIEIGRRGCFSWPIRFPELARVLMALTVLLVSCLALTLSPAVAVFVGVVAQSSQLIIIAMGGFASPLPRPRPAFFLFHFYPYFINRVIVIDGGSAK